MTRRRQNTRRHEAIVSGKYERPIFQPTEQAVTFRQAWSRLMKGLKHTFLPSKYLGRKCWISGKAYKIEGETVDYFFIAAFPNRAFPKVGNKYKIK